MLSAFYASLKHFAKIQFIPQMSELEALLNEIGNLMIENDNNLVTKLLDLKDQIHQKKANLNEFLEDSFKFIETPYLPALTPAEAEATYTLVLDMDETLVHYYEVFNCIKL